MKLLELGLTRKQVFLAGTVLSLIVAALLLRMVVGPLFLALVVTYIMHPMIVRLEKLGLSRSAQAWLLVCLGGVSLVVGAWFLIPLLFEQLHSLVRQIPQFRTYAETRWLPFLYNFLHEYVGSIWKEAKTLSLRDVIPPSLIPSSDLLVASLGRSTRAVLSVILAALLTPFFTFFFISRERQILTFLYSMVPSDLRRQFLPLLIEFDRTLRSVLRSQILVISLLSLLYSSAFALVGMPLGFAIGVITGVMRLVPYMDIVVGGTLAFFVLVTDSTVTLPVVLGVLSSFGVIQILDMLIITPRIVGRFSGIHPFVLILSVLCFADWFGFFGVLLAIPLTAVARVFLKRLLMAYHRSDFFQNGRKWHEERRLPRGQGGRA